MVALPVYGSLNCQGCRCYKSVTVIIKYFMISGLRVDSNF